VNPYVPQGQPSQNLQQGDQGKQGDQVKQAVNGQPAQQQQDQQAQRPDVPQEYAEAYQWRNQIGEEAKAFGGLQNVPQALKWSRMLFGLDQTPEGMTPAGHFLQNLFDSDREVYDGLLTDIATTHAKQLTPLLEEKILAANGIPKERLGEVRDFLKYGRVNVTESAHRDFVGQIAQDCQQIFPKLSESTRNWIVDQVDRGLMTWEFAEEQIREKGVLVALQEREQQQKLDVEQRKTAEAEMRAQGVINESVQRYEDAFVNAKAAQLGVEAETVRDWVARAASELDLAAQQNPKHPARLAWDELRTAAKSANPLRVNAAMNSVQAVFEEHFNAMLARRNGKAPAQNGQQPNGQPPSLRQPQQQQQFEPDKPGGENLDNVSLQDYLFGRAGV
jgi:hypothetical protein